MNVVYEISIGPYKQIGSTCHLKHRMNTHLSYLRRNVHSNSTMQNVWNKYKSFEFKILSEHNTREEAYNAEQLLLDFNFKKDFYMMQNPLAQGTAKGRVSPMKGRKQSAEHIKNLSESRMGYKMSDEQRKNVSDGHIVNTMKIFQYDLFGNFLKEWISIQELKSTKFVMSSIMRCCKGIRKSAHKYKWKFEEENHE